MDSVGVSDGSNDKSGDRSFGILGGKKHTIDNQTIKKYTRKFQLMYATFKAKAMRKLAAKVG